MTLALVLGFLGRNWRLALAVVAALAAVALLAWTRHQGVIAERDRWEKRAEAAEKAIAQHEAMAQAITDKTSADLQAEHVKIEYRTRTLIQKVTTYVPASADAECRVPVGFVHLHDAAAAGVSEPAGGPDEAPSGVPLSAVAETVIGNYGAAYQWRAEALAWRAWYVAQKAAYEAKP